MLKAGNIVLSLTEISSKAPRAVTAEKEIKLSASASTLLDDLKRLTHFARSGFGKTYFIFPYVTHCRCYHSLETMELSSKMVRRWISRADSLGTQTKQVFKDFMDSAAQDVNSVFLLKIASMAKALNIGFRDAANQFETDKKADTEFHFYGVRLPPLEKAMAIRTSHIAVCIALS